MRATVESKLVSSWFKPDPNQPRKLFDEDELRLLGESLKVRQIHPLLVRPDGIIIDGERRWRAAVKAGIEKLDVIITAEQLTPSQIAEMQIVSAMHRQSLTGFEQWQAVERLIELNPGWTGKDIASALQIDASMVVRLRSPGKCIKAVQEAFVAGRIGISDVYSMSKVDEKQQHELLAAKLNGASRDEIAKAARKPRCATSTEVRVSRVKIVLPGGAVVNVASDELDMSGVVDTLATTLKEARKAAEGGYDVKTWQRMMADKAKAGG